MSTMLSSSPSLQVLPLSYPLLLLPAASITLPVSKEQARSIITIVQDNADRSSPSQNIIGTSPVLPPPSSQQPTKPAPTLSRWGCVARIVRLVRPSALQPSQPYLLSLQGLGRFQFDNPPSITHADLAGPLRHFQVTYPPSDTKNIPSKEIIQTFKEAALKLLNRLNNDSGSNPVRKEAWTRLSDLVDEVNDERVSWFADVMVGAVNGEYSDKLEYLSSPDPEARLNKAIEMFTKQTSISEVSKKISTAVTESLSKQQKEFFLRQQLAAIQRELASLNRGGDGNGVDMDDDEQSEQDDMADLKRKIDALADGSEEKKISVREYRRLKRIPQGSVEQGVIRSYLEWLTAIPWPSSYSPSPEALAAVANPQFLVKARTQLDDDHFGLEKIKKRLVEYLAVVRLKHLISSTRKTDNDSKALIPVTATNTTPEAPIPAPTPQSRTVNRAPILLFVGPPGVGKTSLGQSVAKALHRPFQRISLGGVRDEAEIRGHRRTYVASGPGAIVQALRKAGRPDPVLLLDEIDKVGQNNFHGDPSAALLEVLDPEQNHSFNDHYINVPVDLSGVLFICTANTLDTISLPLLDRCEVIQLSGYTYDEKMHIARKFLLPKQLAVNGMQVGQVELTDDALEWIATRYTREAGVRSLERVIGSVVRAKAVEWAEWIVPQETNEESEHVKDVSVSPDESGQIIKSGRGREWIPVVKKDDLEVLLGPPRWDGEEKEREERRGVVWGLVVMGMGEGAIMPVETIAVPGTGRLKLTGSLGDVLKESGEIALSWVKTHAYALQVTNKPSQDPLKVPDPIDVHLHLPAGAQKKDGPSAGVAMVCAFVSLLTGATVPTHIAMTGEITLRGRVTPVGGIKEKVLGAHRAQITKVILPFANRQDVEQDVPKEIKSQMQFVFVRTLEEAMAAAFGSQLDWRAGSVIVESRL